MAISIAPTSVTFDEAFPNSRKIFVDSPGGGRVPFRQIALADSPDGSHNHAVNVYDTSGSQGCDPVEGLPRVREEWIASRGVVPVTAAGSVVGAVRAKDLSPLQTPLPPRPPLRGPTPVT